MRCKLSGNANVLNTLLYREHQAKRCVLEELLVISYGAYDNV